MLSTANTMIRVRLGFTMDYDLHHFSLGLWGIFWYKQGLKRSGITTIHPTCLTPHDTPGEAVKQNQLDCKRGQNTELEHAVAEKTTTESR